MTLRDKLKELHPEDVMMNRFVLYCVEHYPEFKKYYGDSNGCPLNEDGTETLSCKECWSREYEVQE